MEAKIKISDYFDGAAPVLIVNDLKKELYYGQMNVTNWHPSEQRHIKMLPAEHSSYFCWIDPLAIRNVQFKFSLDESEKEKDISLEYDTTNVLDEKYWCVAFFDGKQRVLIFTSDATLPAHLLRVRNHFVFSFFFYFTNFINF